MHQKADPKTEDGAAVENRGGATPALSDGIAAREGDGVACDWDRHGASLSAVNRSHIGYHHGGIEAFKPKLIGGRMREK